ncbi:MAG: amidohydrolase, partial [Armatimonadetes bacterium]|nr:amidohydrolase [Armatimonadota bacterium]
RRAEQLGLPILVHAARQFMSGTPMKYANPILFDEVAQLFPDLRIILAHLGMPWFGDTAVVLRKHPNVYSDVSGVVKQPWGFYNALVLMSENGALDKLLFGSDIPFVSPESTMQALRNVNAVTTGTGLPRIPAEAIEHIIHRDTLGLLGLNRSLSPGRD